MKVVLTREAARDLDAIREPMLSDVKRRLEALGRFPELGAAMTGPFIGYRATVVDLFRIVYRLRRRTIVQVNFIRHCRRAPFA